MESNEFVEALTEGVSGPAELHAKLVADATARANSGDQTIAATGRRDIEWLILLGQLFAPRDDGDFRKSTNDMLAEVTGRVSKIEAEQAAIKDQADEIASIRAKLAEVAEAAEGKETKVSADIKERLVKLEEHVALLMKP